MSIGLKSKLLYMNFSLLELNTLYYALGKREIEARKEFEEFGGEFFQRELDNTISLVERVSDELYNRIKELEINKK